MDLARLLALWAKRDADGRYHPLPCHLIDVAAVTEAMWHHVLPSSGRRYLAAQLQMNESDAARWIPFLAGLHDLGKASPAFQYRWSESAAKATDLGLPTTRFFDGAPHGSVTAKTLPEILDQHFGIPRPIAIAIGTALGGHHGVIPSGADLSQLNLEAVGQAPWQRVRHDLTLVLGGLLHADPVTAPKSPSVSGLMIFAGLVSVADWIGSDATFFPYAAGVDAVSDELDLAEYLDGARQRAVDALGQLGWTGITGTRGLLSFPDLFPALEPNPLQRTVVDVAGSTQEGRCLTIVEAPMGEGKTEAAFYLSDTWGAQPGYRGSYMALPTQATSNQMFSRVRSFLGERYPAEVVNLQLLHGHASLSSEFELLRRQAHSLSPHVTDETRGEEGSVIATEWFTYRKRGLLAPFGVGTVDQTLLAILQSRHVFVRLFGLFQKTVVFDEVHAYDTYMSALLERLLEWLAAIGSSAVVLSATLPATRRDALLAAWQRGLGGPSGDPRPGTPASYPRVTWLAPDSHGSASFATSARSVKNLRLQWVDMALPEAGSPFPLGEQLRATLADGGCAAVICNTVRRAQEVYQALEPYFPGVASDGHPVLDLIHARYLFADRQTREHRALARFGKAGATVETLEGTRHVERPHRAVLVATQVIEQSLDLDFDLMVSDLAPVDLLLQRSGRLHRHERNRRPVRVHDPVLWIGKPGEDSPVPEFERGSAAVYDEHVLLRTWLALQGRESIQVPEEVEELIEVVYDERSCPVGHAAALATYWEETRSRQLDQREAERQEARQRWLRPPSGRVRIDQMMSNPREEDAPDAHRIFQALTRLTGTSVQVVFLHHTHNGPAHDAKGNLPVDLTSPPSLPEARQLLQRSVSLADRRIVFTLLDEPPPGGWLRSAHLRQHRPLLMNDSGVAIVGNYQVTLDQELGVLVAPI